MHPSHLRKNDIFFLCHLGSVWFVMVVPLPHYGTPRLLLDYHDVFLTFLKETVLELGPTSHSPSTVVVSSSGLAASCGFLCVLKVGWRGF